MPVCTKCHIEKTSDNFYKSRVGLRGSCKECMSNAARERRQKLAQSVGCNQKNLTLPSQDELKSMFDYHPDGYFIRLRPRGTQKAGATVIGKMEKSGYRRMPVGYDLFLTHRLIWMWHYGTEPKFIDHINHDRSDNRIENLREVTKNDNAQHQVLPSNNTSGYFGVSWRDYPELRMPACWVAAISHNHEKVHIGYFSNKRDAVLAYNDAANRLHGKFGADKIKHNLEQLERDGL